VYKQKVKEWRPTITVVQSLAEHPHHKVPTVPVQITPSLQVMALTHLQPGMEAEIMALTEHLRQVQVLHLPVDHRLAMAAAMGQEVVEGVTAKIKEVITEGQEVTEVALEGRLETEALMEVMAGAAVEAAAEEAVEDLTEATAEVVVEALVAVAAEEASVAAALMTAADPKVMVDPATVSSPTTKFTSLDCPPI
jgi:hypothetical protein